MDTSTHLVMGISLFGLAHMDPSISASTQTSTAVLLSTVIGSQLPDIDGLYRLKSPSAYIRNHRGWTHSFPMLVIWPLLLSFILSFFFPNVAIGHLLLWSGVSVFIHIFIDLFNTYGTQALRPFSKKWISWNILNIFDPFIFISHMVAFLLWGSSLLPPATIFSTLYFALVVYILWRTWTHQKLYRWVLNHSLLPTEGNVKRITITPTIRYKVYNLLFEEEKGVHIGEIRGLHLIWTGYISAGSKSHPATVASKKAKAVEAFLYFTSYGYPIIYERSFGYEVRWLDVRYHYKKHFPFVSVAFLNKNYQVEYSFVGFMSERHLEKHVLQFERDLSIKGAE